MTGWALTGSPPAPAQAGGPSAVDVKLTRPFRRLYVGNLPEGITQSELSEVGGGPRASRAGATAELLWVEAQRHRVGEGPEFFSRRGWMLLRNARAALTDAGLLGRQFPAYAGLLRFVGCPNPQCS